MWKNKHVIIALLVAPVLSILAWYAVGNLFGEKPEAAEEGKSYKLVARSNCRYASGSCDLHNADLQLTIEPEMLAASSLALSMTSSHPLQSAILGLVDDGEEHPPTTLTATGGEGTEWQGLLPRPRNADAIIRVAVSAQGSTWFVEIPTTWIEAEE